MTNKIEISEIKSSTTFHVFVKFIALISNCKKDYDFIKQHYSKISIFSSRLVVMTLILIFHFLTSKSNLNVDVYGFVCNFNFMWDLVKKIRESFEI